MEKDLVVTAFSVNNSFETPKITHSKLHWVRQQNKKAGVGTISRGWSRGLQRVVVLIMI